MTDAAPFNANVHVAVLLPPLEHAPDQMTLRPLLALNVITVPTANDAEALLPVATLMPAGLELTRSPPRPVAVTVNVAVCPPPPCAAGATVRVAVLVVPLYVAEIVTEVDTDTVLVVRLKPQIVAPAPTSTLAGTLATAGLLLDSVTEAPPCGAPAVSVTVPPPLLPPVTVDGLNARFCSVGGGGGPCGVTVSVATRVAPL